MSKPSKDRIRFKLRVIPEPEPGTRTVFSIGTKFEQDKNKIPFMGKGITDYVCGNCGRMIGRGINLNQIKNIVVKCPKCKSYLEYALYP